MVSRESRPRSVLRSISKRREHPMLVCLSIYLSDVSLRGKDSQFMPDLRGRRNRPSKANRRFGRANLRYFRRFVVAFVSHELIHQIEMTERHGIAGNGISATLVCFVARDYLPRDRGVT